MKSVIPIAASLALALAPAAYAQVSCSEIASLNAYGLDDFDDIAEEEIEEDYYDASFRLSGAEECTVDYAFDSVYSCLWVFASYAEASSALSAQLSAIGPCLAGWSSRNATPDSTATDGYRTLQGVFYEGAGTYIDMEWGVGLEEHTSSSGTDWHVWVDLAYLWF
jgi:hypothetical protein